MTQKKLRLKKKRQRLRKKKEDKQKQQQLDPEPDQLRVPEEEKSSEVSEQVQSENSEAVVENGVENVVDDVIAEVNGTTDSVSNDPVVVDNVVVEIQYVPEQINFHDLAPMYRQFYHVFEAFRTPEYKSGIAPPILATPTSLASRPTPYPLDKFQDDIDSNQEATTEDKTKLSKRKLKQLTRMSVAELKQSVSRPDIVEMQDVTAKDPKLLVQLKSQRNTVPVPRHWCFKRKYLQGKRGFEKPAFNLPDFIRRTGIMEMRATLQDKEDSKTLKTKMRERIRPKMGKIDIDYQKLHDAFFKWQTKPKMTIHGDLYYEGKEFETRLKDKKPGELSEEMRIALGMPVGPSAHRVPPPWLIAMQRYGPPPSYPSLKIPGLNAPIPDGCSFGYHAGGWGKPPVDESGKPLYGDVFGATQDNFEESYDLAIDKTLWGELDSDSGESSDEEADKGDKDVIAESNMDEDGIATPMEGLATPSGLTSIPVGMETPDSIELRKKKIEVEMEMRENQPLYQVLPEKKTDKVGASMMGSTHVYDVNSALAASKHPKEGTVELALDPSELDLDTEAIAARYQEKMRQKETQLQKEDLSDMLAEHVAKQKNKRKKQQITESKPAKKYKDFKF